MRNSSAGPYPLRNSEIAATTPPRAPAFATYAGGPAAFLITGLQARTVIGRISHYPLSQLALSVAVITAVVIVARFVWVFPATYLPRWLFPPVKKKDPSPPWQWPFALAFTGVRGIVSLAAALAIPFATATGQPFPYRDLILFLTFSVILVTLVGQGLLLPWVIRELGLSHAGRKEIELRNIEHAPRPWRQRASGSTSLQRKAISHRT